MELISHVWRFYGSWRRSRPSKIWFQVWAGERSGNAWRVPASAQNPSEKIFSNPNCRLIVKNPPSFRPSSLLKAAFMLGGVRAMKRHFGASFVWTCQRTQTVYVGHLTLFIKRLLAASKWKFRRSAYFYYSNPIDITAEPTAQIKFLYPDLHA